MLGKKTINKKRTGGHARLVAGVLVMVAMVLYVISFTSPAVAGESMGALKGEVIAVDSYGKTLTVRSTEPAASFPMGMSGEVTFSFDRMTNVIRCDQNKTPEDIGVGERVTVTYHENDGNLIADAIDIAPVFLACYDE